MRIIHYLYTICLPLLMVSCQQAERHLVILHTNDVHSAIEPDANGNGGFAMRLAIIDSITQSEGEVLLVDAGDYFQGTPYFNFFGGEVELEAMNKMHYDVITLGNHEFDNGVEALVMQIKAFKGIVVSANYDVSATGLSNYVKPYTILDKNGVKVGVFGLGVNPQGLIKEDLFGAIQYLNPVDVAEEMAENLKKEQKCDVVVCLSHLGYSYPNEPEKVGDSLLAIQTSNIDVIIGGHSHDLIIDKKLRNKIGKEVTIAQMGRNGLYIGKIDVWIK